MNNIILCKWKKLDGVVIAVIFNNNIVINLVDVINYPYAIEFIALNIDLRLKSDNNNFYLK